MKHTFLCIWFNWNDFFFVISIFKHKLMYFCWYIIKFIIGIITCSNIGMRLRATDYFFNIAYRFIKHSGEENASANEHAFRIVEKTWGKDRLNKHCYKKTAVNYKSEVWFVGSNFIFKFRINCWCGLICNFIFNRTIWINRCVLNWNNYIPFIFK